MIRHQSKKRAKQWRDIKPVREEYLVTHSYCMCGCGRQSTDVHEIPRGSHRPQAELEICAWLALNRLCHDDFGDYSKWPVVEQYAVKLLRDPENYDRVRLNQLRSVSGRNVDDSITESDVAEVVLNVARKMKNL